VKIHHISLSTSNTVLNPSTTYYKHVSTVHTQIWPLSQSQGKFHNLSQVSLHSACNNTSNMITYFQFLNLPPVMWEQQLFLPWSVQRRACHVVLQTCV